MSHTMDWNNFFDPKQNAGELSTIQVSSSMICCHCFSLNVEFLSQSNTYSVNLLSNSFAVKVS